MSLIVELRRDVEASMSRISRGAAGTPGSSGTPAAGSEVELSLIGGDIASSLQGLPAQDELGRADEPQGDVPHFSWTHFATLGMLNFGEPIALLFHPKVLMNSNSSPNMMDSSG